MIVSAARQSNLYRVVGTQVTIHDPSVARGKLFLQVHPFIARSNSKACTPEDFVKLDYGKSGKLSQSHRQSRLA